MIPIAAPQLGDNELERIASVFAEGQLADGPEVRTFEEAFAKRCQTDYAVATSNGTTALQTALVALGIGEGDTVVTSPLSFIASANAARLVGANVDFVDIDPDTFNLDPDALETRLRHGDAVDAVIPVHLFGLPADMQRINELQSQHDFAVIEDAAQAHDAAVGETPVGSLGDVGCFSCYPTKNMTTAEGGLITTDRAEVAERARTFIDHGRAAGYEHQRVGQNFRMTSVHAAIGNAQLDRLDAFTEARRENAHQLNDRLAEAPLTTPTEPSNRRHVYHQYTVRHPDRDALQNALASRGVGTKIYYPIPIHNQPAYADIEATFPEAERAAQEVLSLPVHPGVSDEDIEQIHESVTASVGAIA